LYKIRKQAETVLTSDSCIGQTTLHANQGEDLAKYILKRDNFAQVFVRSSCQVYQQQQPCISHGISCIV
jgi:hypothetical protein